VSHVDTVTGGAVAALGLQSCEDVGAGVAQADPPICSIADCQPGAEGTTMSAVIRLVVEQYANRTLDIERSRARIVKSDNQMGE
jgi:hypothetical protein